MTDALLALVPTYGIWLVFFSLTLSCLALPLPSSILVMAAGAFAAAGDMVLWQVQAAALAGFVIGDQIAYGVAATGGARLIARLRSHRKFDALFIRAETMLARFGTLAVFLSRTIFSPVGPYLGYLSGLVRLRWLGFTLASVAGAICWCAAYSLLGYFFASRIAQIAGAIGNALGLLLAIAAIGALGWYLWTRWREEDAPA